MCTVIAFIPHVSATYVLIRPFRPLHLSPHPSSNPFNMSPPQTPSPPLTPQTPPEADPDADFSRERSRSRSIFRRPTASLSPEEQKDTDTGIRYVRLNDHPANLTQNFISNQLRSAKYTPLNIIPKALYEQFRRVSNFYFLVIAIISFIPGVSPTTPLASVAPLLVVVGFGFARDVYEDLNRAADDRRSNSEQRLILARVPEPIDARKSSLKLVSPSLAHRLQAAGLEPDLHRVVPSRAITVGDLVLVRKGQVFPCDLVLLHSSGEGGIAYVSTANLDGESTLKRTVVVSCTSHIEHPSQLRSLTGKLRAQPPVTALHAFEASVMLQGQNPEPLDASNLMLRGSILRNTDYIYGLAVYTGFDTKVALNMRHPPSKMGSVERKLNWVVFMLFIILAVLVVAASVTSGFLQGNLGPDQWYMGEFRYRSRNSTIARGLATFLILFSTFIPVSLFVTLEFIRVLQALFMTADFRMKTGKQAVAARATNLNEMLGEVEHVLSDKTGTLTENIMRYIACSADGIIYNILKKKRVMERAVEDGVEPIKHLILAMALCHTVVPEPKSDGAPEDPDDTGKSRKKKRNKSGNSGDTKGEQVSSVSVPDMPEEESLPEYQGESPDEVALVTSAREYGVTLLKRTFDSMHIERFGQEETYTSLAELEFNSNRKRMSMIFRCPDGKIRMYTKGADTIMLTLLNRDVDYATIQNHIDEFAKEGLRTLVFAYKELSTTEFDAWFARFQEARNSVENREEKTAQVSAELEQDLAYIATTAVEDKLQDKVPETIKFLREAGIKLWVLTGDKRETAENIGYSANLLDREMDVVHIAGKTSEEIEKQLGDTLDKHIADDPGLRTSLSFNNMTRRMSFREPQKTVEEKELGIIIDGASLHHAIEDHDEVFMALSDHAKVVICCRVTPLQKAMVVRLVREKRKAMTLAIGDGGNDVSMIQEAHIGVGIFGKEGTQAARAADYAMGEFKHLLRLTAIHGRYSGLRTAGMINLSFYKNIFFTMTQVFFQIFNFVSGTTFHNQWVTSAFNVVVTSASPFLYGIFERDLDEETVLRFPSVYATNRDKKMFSIRSVLEYTTLYGLWHAVVVFFGVYLTFGYLKIAFTDGKDSGFVLTGLVTSTLAVLMTLFKILLHSHTLNLIVLFAMALSVGVYVAVVPLAIYVAKDLALEGSLVMLFSSPTFYLASCVIMVASFLLDFIVLTGRQLLFPSVVDRLRRWEIDEKKKVKAA